MKKIYLSMFFMFLMPHLHSQNLYVYAGKNMTKYDYKTSNGQPTAKLVSGSGNYYEIGYETSLKEKCLSYMSGISLNQFNSTGGNEVTQLAWKTNYLGLQNTLGCSLLKNKTGLNIKANLGLNIATIIQGDQIVNNVYQNIAKQEEFKGIFLQTSGGVDIRYNVQKIFDLSLKYNLSKAVNVTNSSVEKLSFINNQVAFGIIFPVNNSKTEQMKKQAIIEEEKAAQKRIDAQREILAQEEKASAERIAASEKEAQDKIEAQEKLAQANIETFQKTAQSNIEAQQKAVQQKIEAQEKAAQSKIKSQTKKAQQKIAAQLKAAQAKLAQEPVSNQNK